MPELAAHGLRFLRRRWRVLVALTGWSLLEAGQTFLGGYALARALDTGFLAHRTAVGLYWLAAAAVGIGVGAVGTGRSFLGVAGLAEPLRDALVTRVVTGGLRDAVAEPHRADTAVVSRLTQQVEIARDSFAGLVVVARSFVFTALGALVGLLSLSGALLLVVAPPLVLGLAVFALALRPMARAQRAFLTADEALAEAVGQTAAGLRDVVACGAEEHAARWIRSGVDAEYTAARVLARWGMVRVAALGLGGRLPVLLLLVTAPWLLDHGVTAGALVGAMTYVTQSLLPALQSLVQGFGGAGTRLTVVLRALVRGGAALEAPEAHAGGEVAGAAVELRQVSFGYGGTARLVVHDLDLVLPVGTHLAVVGPSGIGKSTLANLISGLLRPDSGEVLVNGEPAGRSRSRVLIPQEAYVFSGTVRDNLRYLCADPVPDEALRRAAEAVGAGRLVRRLGGLDAAVDPTALSAGERQLLALGRAYACPVPLVLLDEATCHLDPAAEARAERAFAARPGGTLVVVAHRISSARRADLVLVMDGARAMCGRHAELLADCGLYRDLVGQWDAVGSGSQPAGALGYPDGVNPVAGTGLAVDGRHVVPHRAVTQVQPAGDLGHRGTLGGE
ncbi:ABC transporter ATP-binding protein/permease [Streptomyces rubrisoli]|uniref:ABC transporter ATP-binding protein/permease n=1 Tax=Streptantibioticus rubrisoli TaxID=1387313 RepID=A0ABT1PM23_9ACTN|nr:ABC transporter ATP-binding protein [Streptantibioticus rubrisoli]MCQ4046404.1 ABC transporter ATP-binding protein/permease [Streptantibioticus rubrisoli]